MIEFFDTNNQKGFASIYDTHITFNKSLMSYFSNAYRVRVGIEKDSKKIYVFLMNKDYCMSNEVPESSLLPISMSKTYVRVCSRAMINYIISSFSINIPKGSFLRYAATYDEKNRAIIINLGEEA